MTLTMPDGFRELLGDGPKLEQEVSRRLAAHFYSVGDLGIGRAAALAGMRRDEFEAWLRKLGVEIPWTQEDLQAEISNCRHWSVSRDR